MILLDICWSEIDVTIGTLVNTKEEAKRLRREFNKAFPTLKYGYSKNKLGSYWVIGDDRVSVGGKATQ